MNEKNLIPNSKRSPSELRENGSKGGKKSGRTRSLRAKMKQLCSLDVADPDIKNFLKENGVEETDFGTAMMFMQMYKAVKEKDTTAFKAVMETVGESIRHEELAIRKKELKIKENELKKAQEEKETSSSFKDAIIAAYEKRTKNDE